jgi:hypothetical protein
LPTLAQARLLALRQARQLRSAMSCSRYLPSYADMDSDAEVPETAASLVELVSLESVAVRAWLATLRSCPP